MVEGSGELLNYLPKSSSDGVDGGLGVEPGPAVGDGFGSDGFIGVAVGSGVGVGSEGSTGVGVIFGSTGVAVGENFGVGEIIGSAIGGIGVIIGSGVPSGCGVTVGVGAEAESFPLATVVAIIPETTNKNVVDIRINFFSMHAPFCRSKDHIYRLRPYWRRVCMSGDTRGWTEYLVYKIVTRSTYSACARAAFDITLQ